MSKQTINIGASPNDGTGTPLRTSFDYTNQNFTELYTALGGGVGLPGATTQVIFNDGGTNLAGDAGLVYNKTTDALTVGGAVNAASATITGALTVQTNALFVNSANNNVGLGTLTPTGASGRALEIYGGAGQSRIALKNDATGSASTDGSQIALVGSQLVIQNREASEITFETSNSERYRLDSSGVATWSNVGGVAGTAMTLNSTGLGIGKASPGYKLVVAAATGNVMQFENTSDSDRGGRITNTGTAGTGKFGLTTTSSGYALSFGIDAVEKMLLDTSGNFGVGVTPAGTGGCLQLKSGITFPATQVASSDANTLDDYEEGTWTPTITFATLSVGVTYAAQTAIYTKVGRIVHFSGRIDLSSKGTSVGGAVIAGLPFAANTGAASVGFQTSIAPSGSQAMLTIDGTTLIIRYASTTTTAQSTNSDFSNSSIIIFSGTYAV